MSENTIHPMINIYKVAKEGQIAVARSSMARYFSEGVSNPRARLLDYHQSNNLLCSGVLEVAKRMDDKGLQTNETWAYWQDYLKIRKNVMSPQSHQMIAVAYSKLQEAYENLPLTPKNRSFSNFIIAKNKYPILNRCKFLAKFF